MCFAEKMLLDLSKKIERAYSHEKIEDTLGLIKAKARLEYEYNQVYKDDESERLLVEITKKYFEKVSHKRDNGTVLFYDGFGLDTRGLARIYLKALVENHYRVIYVTKSRNSDEQPEIMSILNKGISVKYHCSSKKCFSGAKELCQIFQKESFSVAFFYSTPSDVEGVIAFNQLLGQCTRYQINLTDHAFWLGINSFDYCIEFRNYGAAISRDYRRVCQDRLVYLPYYPMVNTNCVFEGFPFDTEGKKIVFSGGAIYKTIDSSNTFYRIVENLLEHNPDVVFVYASATTCAPLNKLLEKYPSRAYHINERRDLLKVLEHSYLYLNTYPISGALMLQYAALAKCIPITIKRVWDDDASGILLNEDELGETFTEFDEVIAEIDKLLSDKAYYYNKKKALDNQVITEENFTSRLSRVIENPSQCLMNCIESVETEKFRETYKQNVTREIILNAIIRKDEINVCKYYPTLFFERIVNKMISHFQSIRN